MTGARFIHFDRVENRLLAVYGDAVQQEYLEPISSQLRQLPGVRTRITRENLAGSAATVIEVRPQNGTNSRGAIARMTKLTQPALQYTIGEFTFTLLPCDCGCTCVTSHTNMSFVNGLGPEDEEGFRYKYDERVKALRLDKLLGEPPHEQLKDALQEVLRALGVYAAELNVLSEHPTPPCTHPK